MITTHSLCNVLIKVKVVCLLSAFLLLLLLPLLFLLLFFGFEQIATLL